jgi:hypothetical protein
MRLIIDMQGFKDERNRYIPKELAAFDGNQLSHYVFKKPYPLSFLSRDLHKQATWLMKNHHHIDWNSGFTPLHHFSSIMEHLTKETQFVYVKGGEKADYIRRYSKQPVIEINEQPSLRPSIPKCFNHSKSPTMCALSNVMYIYDNLFMNE